jgi:hypothetical protein
MGLMMICCGMTVKGIGMLGVGGARKMKVVTVKRETVPLIDKDRS